MTDKERRLDDYCNMINDVDSKLAEISQIISKYDCRLSKLVDVRLTAFVDHLESQNSKLKGEIL